MRRITKADAMCFDDVRVVKLIYAFVFKKKLFCILEVDDNFFFFFIIIVVIVIVFGFTDKFWIVNFKRKMFFTNNIKDFLFGSSSK